MIFFYVCSCAWLKLSTVIFVSYLYPFNNLPFTFNQSWSYWRSRHIYLINRSGIFATCYEKPLEMIFFYVCSCAWLKLSTVIFVSYLYPFNNLPFTFNQSCSYWRSRHIHLINKGGIFSTCYEKPLEMIFFYVCNCAWLKLSALIFAS